MAQILIADDVVPRNEDTARGLRGAGHEVALVTDGRVAWERLADEPLDLLITKMMLPFVDGYLLAAHLRQSGSKALVLMIAPLGADREPMRDEETGLVDAHLVASVDAAELVRKAERLLRDQRR